jgi:hypothetical protein
MSKIKPTEETLRNAFYELFQIRNLMSKLKEREEKCKEQALQYAELFLFKNKTNVIVEEQGVRAMVTIGERIQYEYPPEIQKLEEKLKQMKKKAEQDGTAKVVGVSRYLTFRFEKDK